nr:cytochrome c biogenesis heme-transporting ATPase CcmA [uncultured Ralstonia sp.]
MLVASQLTFSRAGRRIFRELDLSVSAGELVQVTGANGSGKTTLLRVLCGLLAPASGSLTWHGAPVRSGDPTFLGALCYVGHTNGIDPDLTVAESLRLAMQLAGLRDAESEPFGIRHALEALDLGKLAATPVRKLSQGQRRRVALARLLIARRELWLLDEPIASLDDHAVGLFTAQLDAHLRAGGMAIMTTHQVLARPEEGSDRVLRLGTPAGGTA